MLDAPDLQQGNVVAVLRQPWAQGRWLNLSLAHGLVKGAILASFSPVLARALKLLSSAAEAVLEVRGQVRVVAGFIVSITNRQRRIAAKS